MGWIKGFIQKKTLSKFDLKSFIDEQIDYQFQQHNIQIFAGGVSSNLNFSNLNSNKEFDWLVSGIGLQNNNESTRIFSYADWDKLINSDNQEKPFHLDGHYVLLKWNEKELFIYTDQLGLRDIYIAENNDYLVFSTDAVWISKLFSSEINFEEFGSSWLLFNQFSTGSVFTKTRRVVSGESVKINLINYQINFLTPEKEFSLEDTGYSFVDFFSELKSYVNLKLEEGQKLSLSLSGGMDSRVLLSFLLRSDNRNWETHTFGNPEHPDSKIAMKLAAKFGFKHEQFDSKIPAAIECINGIESYTAKTIVNNPASAFLQLKNYEYLNERNTVIIDGGFGELWRREFFYKLFFSGRKYLYNKDVKNIIPSLRVNRADIFNKDINNLMEAGIEKQITQILNSLPKVTEDNIYNWLDLLAIKYRLSSFYLREQARMDIHLQTIMPFVQQKITQNLFRTPVKLRANGNLFRKIIEANEPLLKKVVLAKGVSVHPYSFNSLQSRILSKLQRGLNFNIFSDNRRTRFLNSLKEFVFDSINSINFKNTEFYDHNKIRHLVENYYSGSLENENELDWFISFEIFRQKLFK